MTQAVSNDLTITINGTKYDLWDSFGEPHRGAMAIYEEDLNFRFLYTSDADSTGHFENQLTY